MNFGTLAPALQSMGKNFGSLADAGNDPNNLIAALKAAGGPQAPAVPADGAMQPTIGPGPAAPGMDPTKHGPLTSLLVQMMQRGQMPSMPGQSLAGGMPPAGMMPGVGMPGSPMAGPVAPVQLPMNINPADQF